MRGMILAAGRGQRMGTLTDHTPKPLLRVGNAYLIEYAIDNFKQAGIHEVVINVAYLGEQIIQALGDGTRYGMQFFYSREQTRLEVGGGLIHALPLLGKEAFIVQSADVICDFPLHSLLQKTVTTAHFVLVDNPPFHPQGDFGLSQGYIDTTTQPFYNYAGIGVYHPQLFSQQTARYLSWRDLMWPSITAKKITGEYYAGRWHNIGTPQDIQHFLATR